MTTLFALSHSRGREVSLIAHVELVSPRIGRTPSALPPLSSLQIIAIFYLVLRDSTI